MILTILALTAAVHAAPDPCAWDNPGRDPYRNVHEMTVAIDDFGPLSAADKATIKQKMVAHQYDDFVIIRKGSIISDSKDAVEYTDFRDMHSGHSVCHGPVTMKSWGDGTFQHGMVYCASTDVCVVVPLVCNNVSLLTRKRESVAEYMPLAMPDTDPIDVSPAAGPMLASAEDGSFTSVIDTPPGTAPYTFYQPPYFGGYDGGGGYIGCPHVCSVCDPVGPPVPPITVVLEPSYALLYALGLFTILGRHAYKRRRFDTY